MKKYRLIIVITFIIIAFTTNAQDPHYTNYRNLGSFFNPSAIGNFLGTAKFQGAVRTQYDKTYQHGGFGVQLNAKSPLSENHWLGFGADFLMDQAGSLKLSAKGGGIGIGYHIIHGKNDYGILSIGSSIKNINLGADPKAYLSEQVILGNANDRDIDLLTDFERSLFSVNAGISYQNVIGKKSSFSTGIAMTHINQPSFFFNKGKNKSTLGQRLNLNFIFKTDVSNTVMLEPAIYYSMSEHQNNLNLQLLSYTQLKKEANWRVISGLSARGNESIDLILGYGSEQLNITASYDYVYNGLSNPLKTVGAIELGAYYILIAKETPERKAEALCPRL